MLFFSENEENKEGSLYVSCRVVSCNYFQDEEPCSITLYVGINDDRPNDVARACVRACLCFPIDRNVRLPRYDGLQQRRYNNGNSPAAGYLLLLLLLLKRDDGPSVLLLLCPAFVSAAKLLFRPEEEEEEEEEEEAYDRFGFSAR